MLPIRTILYPTDFSPRSDVACQFACSLARDYRARLILIHVVHEPAVAFGVGPITSDKDAAEGELQAWSSLLATRFAPITVEYRLAVGNPAPEILRLAGELKSDLIVMGTHGRTGLGRLVLGSVAEHVLRSAACPVITVKTPLASWTGAVPAVAATGRDKAGV